MTWLGLLLLGIVLYVIGAVVAEVAFLTTVGIILAVVAAIWLVVSYVGGRSRL